MKNKYINLNVTVSYTAIHEKKTNQKIKKTKQNKETGPS